MHLIIGKKRLGMILASLLFVFFLTSAAQAAEKNYDELFVYIGDSLMKAKSGDVKAISENMALFESEWNAVKTDSELAQKVDERLLDVKNALEKDNNSEQIKQLPLLCLDRLLHMMQRKIQPIKTRRKNGFKH